MFSKNEVARQWSTSISSIHHHFQQLRAVSCWITVEIDEIWLVFSCFLVLLHFVLFFYLLFYKTRATTKWRDKLWIIRQNKIKDIFFFSSVWRLSHIHFYFIPCSSQGNGFYPFIYRIAKKEIYLKCCCTIFFCGLLWPGCLFRFFPSGFFFFSTSV